MKKSIILLFFIPFIIKAQQDQPLDKFYLGIQAGLNISKFRNPIDYHKTSLFEPNRSSLPLVGLNVTMPFNKYLNFRIGALYSLKGTNFLDSVFRRQENCKIRYNYLDFPIIAQIKTGNFLRFEAGIVPSVVMNSKALYNATGDSIVKLSKYGSGIELSLYLGAEVTLQKGIDIGFSYEIPTRSSAFDNIRFTLTYIFERDLFNKTPKVNVTDDFAYQQIIDVRNNAILVRLKTSDNQINALKKMGRPADAEELQKKQYARNREIMTAFKNNFNFCPLYFFYSSSSNDIKNNQFNGHLLNDSLIADTTIKFNFKKAYISEFDFIEPDTIYTGQSLNNNKSNQADSSFTISNTHLTEALVIRNSYFTQLKEPFPYYVKMYNWGKHLSYAMAVGIFNNQLHNFLKQSMQSNHL